MTTNTSQIFWNTVSVLPTHFASTCPSAVRQQIFHHHKHTKSIKGKQLQISPKTSPNLYTFPYQLKNLLIHLEIFRPFLNADFFFNINLRRPGKVRTSGFHKILQLYKLKANKSNIILLDHSFHNTKTLTIIVLGSPRSSLTAKEKVTFPARICKTSY